MSDSFMTRIKHAWDVFIDRDRNPMRDYDQGPIDYTRPDRVKLNVNSERTVVNAILNRISIDVAAININHVRLDDNNRFVDVIKSGLNECLTIEANIDQTGRAFIQDIVMSVLDEGCIAVVPTETSFNPRVTNSYDINSMRVGKIIEWRPEHVKVNLYNQHTGRKEDVLLPKKQVAIIENPLYSVMNEKNSTLQRLLRKMRLLDMVDEQSGAGKLDLIIQLPYIIKSEQRKAQAEARRADIERQLKDSKYGIAYTDGTEKVTQLNRSVENNLLKQVESLTELLYSQLGITQEILNGTANDATMTNYYSRTIEPIISAICDEFKRKFLTKTARTQNQSIMFFRDPFKLVPVQQIADIADKFTRNEIMTSNEIRQIVGMRLSADPNADQLRNKNINQSETQLDGAVPEVDVYGNPMPSAGDPYTEEVDGEMIPVEENGEIIPEEEEPIQGQGGNPEARELIYKIKRGEI